MQHSTLRMAITVNSVFVVVSAAIVTGIASYFMLEYWERNFHLVFHEAIAVITMVLYGMGLVFPFIDTYKGWRAPFHVVFAGLWLAAFVFAVQDFTGGRCSSHGFGPSECGLKKTELAFDFIAFVFLISNSVTETLLWRAHRLDAAREAEANAIPASKERGSVASDSSDASHRV